jgi:hypothetical protein
MISDIFNKIDEVHKIYDSIYDVTKFCKLTDQNIFNLLTPEASIIYKNIHNKKLYKCLAKSDNLESFSHHKKNDFQIIKVNIGYVSGNNINPYEKIYFHDDGTSESFTLSQEEIYKLTSNIYHEVYYLLIYKNFNEISKL